MPRSCNASAWLVSGPESKRRAGQTLRRCANTMLHLNECRRQIARQRRRDQVEALGGAVRQLHRRHGVLGAAAAATGERLEHQRRHTCRKRSAKRSMSSIDST